MPNKFVELYICINVNMYEYSQYVIQIFIYLCFYIIKVHISLGDMIDHGSVNRASKNNPKSKVLHVEIQYEEEKITYQPSSAVTKYPNQ